LQNYYHSRAEPFGIAPSISSHRSGQYDYYAYIEDDIVVTDALFLSKRHLFDQRFGPEALLQPQSL